MLLEQPIETKRLIFREFRKEDEAEMCRYETDPAVARFVRYGPNTESMVHELLQRILMDQRSEPRTNFNLAVELKSEKELIGSCGLFIKDNRCAEIGYTFAQAYWGHGFATEAGLALLAFGFDQLTLHRMFATCDVRNIASRRVMEKLGMRPEGHFLQDVWQRDHWRDSYLYAVLEQEWKAKHDS